MKDWICAAAGMIGAAVAAFFGGWDGAMTTLVIFMAIDYATGLLVAGVFHKSEKTQHGGLESRAGWKGLVRKGVTLLIVYVACRLDLLLGTNYVRDAVIIAFVLNEVLSITENAALMGVPIPAPIQKAIELLRAKSEPEQKDAQPAERIDAGVDYKTGYMILLDELTAARSEIAELTAKEEVHTNDGSETETERS